MKTKICIVKANFYPEISSKLLFGCKKELPKNHNSDSISVPGIFEIPIVIAKEINSYDAFIVLGCVIKGKTPHFKFISQTVLNAIMDLSIKHKKPIGNGIITCLNKKQALERAHTYKTNKGKEAAIAVLSVLKILKENYAPS